MSQPHTDLVSEERASSEPDYSLALEEARRGFDALADEVTTVRNRAVSKPMSGFAEVQRERTRYITDVFE
jgi:hypothetical protein